MPSVNGSNAKSIALAANKGEIALAWEGGNNRALLSRWNGSAWRWGSSGSVEVESSVQKVDLAFSKNADSLAVVYGTTNNRAKLRVARLSNNSLASATTVSEAADAVAVAYAPNGRIHVSYNNRESQSPKVAYYASNRWTTVSTSGYANGDVSLHTVGRKTNIVIDKDNRPIISYDDNFFAPYISVWRYENSEWVLQGESKLPYFAEPFWSENGYYIYGSSPSLAIGSSGSLYLGLMGIDARGANATNNGPMVFKYQP